MAKVYVTRKIPQAGLDMLSGHELVVGDEMPPAKDEIAEKAKGVEAILSVLTEKIDKEVIESAGPQLKIISNFAVGVDNIDLEAAREKGITVTSTPGVLTQAVAEHTWALIMSVVRRVVEADKFMRAGKYTAWGPELLLGGELKGKTLGIWGMGRIGYEVGRIGAQGFGMKVIYNDIKQSEFAEKDYAAQMVDVPTLFRESDIVSIHVNLTPENHHLVNEEVLAHMRPHAYLVNTSRGPIVNEAELVEALRDKRIAGAGLDVFEDEPAMKPGLAELDNVVVTPHIASATRETRDAMAKLAAQAILDVFAGKVPENIVADSK